MPVRARFRPHPRGFGFATPVADDGLTETSLTAPNPDGVPTEHDRAFVPPPVARALLADDLVDVEVEVDDKGATVTGVTLVERPRKLLVGVVQHGPGGFVLEPDAQLGSGSITLAESVASRVPTSVGRVIVVLLGEQEDGSPLGRALVAGPFVAGSPQAIRAAATVLALGRAAPQLVPGGPGAAGLAPDEAMTLHTRIVGLLAGGGRGGAAGLDPTGPVPGAQAPWYDRRDEACITVDDASARDLDDAVAATWDGSEEAPVHVAVHIADVGRAVGLDAPADRYARVAAATAYLAVGDNAPMLDPALSEGTLSLLPGEDRFALSVRFAVAPTGQLTEVDVEVAAITSRARLSYEAVQHWLDGDQEPVRTEAGLAARDATAVLRATLEAARRLGAERDARVTLEDLFEQPEVEPAIVDGRLTTVEAEPHAEAYRVIERLMVAANEAAASWLVARDVPALYRAHRGVDPERAARLRAATELVGVDVPALADGGDEDKVFAQLVAAIEQLDAEGRTGDRDLLVAAATSATARATYDPDPSAHRGLAATAYCHFTSPIRRYADLVVHRQIRAALAGEEPPYTSDQLRALARWLDARAGAIGFLASRERGDLWARLLDRGFLDAPEPAVVTGLTENGLRVRLPRLGVTGFVTAERVLGLGPKERGRLEVDEHGLRTTAGTWQLGRRVLVRFVGLDATGRTVWRLGEAGAA